MIRLIALVLVLLTACGVDEESHDSDPKFLTGAGPTRGHEDITRLAVEEADAGFPEVPYGLNAAFSDQALIKGNYETDFPTDKLRSFYNAMGADWHNDGRLQHIHSLRGAENGRYRNNYASCRLQQDTIRRASAQALAAFNAGNRDEGLYWTGHATHVIQDSFSAAHTRRAGHSIVEFCTYGAEFPGICHHETVDLRDRVWHEGISCQADPTNRSQDCLSPEARAAVDATASYLVGMSRMMRGEADQLNGFFSDYFNCDAVPNLPFGLRDVRIESNSNPVSQCKNSWKSAGADLNDGALGRFVDLCQQYGDVSNPITALTVVTGKDASCPDGFERHDKNLNDGTPKGEKIYLCTSRQPGPALMEIKATSHKNGGNRCGDGWNWINVDLNKGAGGNYVFFCYR